jgi:hypothetical protein
MGSTEDADRYYRAPDELKARLDALVGQNRW